MEFSMVRLVRNVTVSKPRVNAQMTGESGEDLRLAQIFVRTMNVEIFIWEQTKSVMMVD
jgi:hypothetical protein